MFDIINCVWHESHDLFKGVAPDIFNVWCVECDVLSVIWCTCRAQHPWCVKCDMIFNCVNMSRVTYSNSVDMSALRVSTCITCATHHITRNTSHSTHHTYHSHVTLITSHSSLIHMFKVRRLHILQSPDTFVCVCHETLTCAAWHVDTCDVISVMWYGGATISRLLKIVGLFCRI